MTQGLAVRNTYPEHLTQVEPQLRLLVESEPRLRVFLRNIFDLIRWRTEPPLFLASQPVLIHRYRHVRTGVHWMVVLESVVWHMAAVPLLLLLWTWSLHWDARHYPVQRSRMTRNEQITYYPLEEAFPAREGRQSTDSTSEKHPAKDPTIQVAKEERRAESSAPDVAIRGDSAPDIKSGTPNLPAVPISATTRAHLDLPADLASAIGPAPDAKGLRMRSVDSPGSSVIAPAPQLKGLRRSRGINVPTADVVAPTPAAQGLGLSRMGAVGIGASTAVPPAPQLSLSEQRAGRGAGRGIVAASGFAVVPPAPSVRGRAFSPGGSGNLANGSGTVVVAPSPSMGSGVVLAAGRGNSLAGAGTQVVPPVPSLQGKVYLAGNGGGSIGGVGTQVAGPAPSLGNGLLNSGGQGNSLGGTGLGVVPPAPAIASSGIGGGRGRTFAGGDGGGLAVAPTPSLGQIGLHGGNGRGGAGLGGDGEQVVAPAPSIGGTGLGSIGTGHGGGGNSLGAGLGAQTVAPPAFGNGGTGAGTGGGGTASGTGQDGGLAGASGGGQSAGGTETLAKLGMPGGLGNTAGAGAAPIINSAIPQHAEVPDLPAGKTQVVPLRVIQLALALPMTSYFSNYEAFIAERSVGHDTTQLIKLVYIFLPYQRRLTEFGVNASKTFNLRVTRDPSCDESLLSMTWPEGESRSKPAESSKDKLPCYRTTADDYRKAWEKVH